MARWFFQTEEDREAARQRKADREDDREARRELKFYLDNFPDWLANSGIAHWTIKAESEFKFRHKVRFIKGDFNSDTFYLQIDARRMPHPHRVNELHTDEILETLSLCVGKAVAWENVAPEYGAFYVISRDGVVGAIPKDYPFRNALNLLNEDKGTRPLEFVVGASKNKRASHIDLAKAPHYLIGGSTFTGKSVHINSMLCQMISRNRPDTLRLVLIDMKGTEFNFYEELPHLWLPVVTKLDGVVPTLEEVEKEIHRRNDLFSKEGIKTLEGYNHQHPEAPMPYIVVVIDELAEILKSYDRSVAKAGENVLGRTIMIARSAGIHYVLSTQRPSSEVVPAWIKAQASTRIAFSMAGIHDSMVVIDSADAKGLEPAGRAIYQAGHRRIEVQSPFISDEQIQHVVREAIKRELEPGEEPPPEEVGLQDLLNEAIDNYKGALKEKELYEVFRGRIGRDQIRKLLQSLNGDPVTVHGKLYKVEHKRRGIVTTRVLTEQPRRIEELPTQSAKLSHGLFPRGRGRGQE